MARKSSGRRPISCLNRFHLYIFSVIHTRWRDYSSFLIKFLGLWLLVWIINTLLLWLFRPALLSPTDDGPIAGLVISFSKSAAASMN